MLGCGFVVKWTDHAHKDSFNFDSMNANDLPRKYIEALVNHLLMIFRRGLTP